MYVMWLVMGRAGKSRVRASPRLKKSSPIESESWLFQKNRVRVGQKMPSQIRVDAESSLGPSTSETFWVWASPSLKKVEPKRIGVLTLLAKSSTSWPKNAESELSRCRVLTRTHHYDIPISSSRLINIKTTFKLTFVQNRFTHPIVFDHKRQTFLWRSSRR